MKLKSQYHFIGNKETSTIQYASIQNREKNRVVEVDKFSDVWKIISLLDKGASNPELVSFCNNQGIDLNAMNEILAFLKDNKLLYLDDICYTKENKKQLAFTDYISGTTGKTPNFAAATIYIIGVGTVGSNLIDKFVEIGVRKFVVFDFDEVEPGNIIHQKYFTPKDIGQNKTIALSKHILIKYGHLGVSVDTYERSLTIEDTEIATRHTNSHFFWCADSYTEENREAAKVLLNNKKTIYKAGYSLYQACVIALRTPKDIDDYFKEFDFQISDNAGLSIEGEISAALMVRLWVSNVFFGSQKDRIVIDTITFKITEDISRFDDVDLLDKLQILYIEYLRTGNPEIWERIMSLEGSESLIDTDTPEVECHQALLSSIHIKYKGEMLSVEQVVVSRLQGKLPNAVEIQIADKLYPLIATATELIKSVPPLFDLNEQEDAISKSIKDICIKEYLHNTIDLAKYTPFEKQGMDLTIALKLVKETYGDESIEHLIRGDLLCTNAKNSLAVYRYKEGVSYILLDYQNRLDDLVTLAHEIGHSYYNALVPNKFLYDMESVFSEICAFQKEYQLFDYMIQKGMQEDAISLYQMKIIGIMMGHYSLNFYRKHIYDSIEKYGTWDISKTRDKVFKDFAAGAKIVNKDASDYNSLTSLYFLKGESVNTYVKAFIYSIGIYKEYGKELKEYIMNSGHETLSLDGFLQYADIEAMDILNHAENTCREIMNEPTEMAKYWRDAG